MEGTSVAYTIQQFIADGGEILTGLLDYMGEILGFFTTNSAFMWTFAVGGALLGYKLLTRLAK